MYALKKEQFFKRAEFAKMELKVSQKHLHELESALPMFSVVDRVELERLKTERLSLQEHQEEEVCMTF